MSKSQVERECILCINSIIQYNEAMSFKLLHGTIFNDKSANLMANRYIIDLANLMHCVA
jgi:hypothetical protein